MDIAKALEAGRAVITAGGQFYRIYRGLAELNATVGVNARQLTPGDDDPQMPWEFRIIVDITNVGKRPVTLLSIRVLAQEVLPTSVFEPMDGATGLPAKLAPDEWARYSLSGVFQRADVTAKPRRRRSIDGEWIDIQHSHSSKPVRIWRKDWGIQPDLDKMRAP